MKTKRCLIGAGAVVLALIMSAALGTAFVMPMTAADPGEELVLANYSFADGKPAELAEHGDHFTYANGGVTLGEKSYFTADASAMTAEDYNVVNVTAEIECPDLDGDKLSAIWVYEITSEESHVYEQEHYLGMVFLAGERNVNVERYANTNGRPDGYASGAEGSGTPIPEEMRGGRLTITVSYDPYGATNVTLNGEDFISVGRPSDPSFDLSIKNCIGENPVLYIGKANWGEYADGLTIYSLKITAVKEDVPEPNGTFLGYEALIDENGNLIIDSPINFSNAAFAKYAATFDTDKDGALSEAEAKAVTSFEIDDLSVFNQTTGLWFFPNVASLVVTDTENTSLVIPSGSLESLVTVDASKASKLNSFDSAGRILTEVKLPGTIETITLAGPSAALDETKPVELPKGLDLAALPKLSAFAISDYPITSLDVPKTLSGDLTVYNTLLTELDVSGSEKLFNLYVDGNSKLKSVNAAGCKALDWAPIYNNARLESVDFSDCTNLPNIVIDDNPMLTTVKCDGCKKIDWVNLSYDLSLTSFDASALPELFSFQSEESGILKADLSKNTKLKELLIGRFAFIEDVKLPEGIVLNYINCALAMNHDTSKHVYRFDLNEVIKYLSKDMQSALLSDLDESFWIGDDAANYNEWKLVSPGVYEITDDASKVEGGAEYFETAMGYFSFYFDDSGSSINVNIMERDEEPEIDVAGPIVVHSDKVSTDKTDVAYPLTLEDIDSFRHIGVNYIEGSKYSLKVFVDDENIAEIYNAWEYEDLDTDEPYYWVVKVNGVGTTKVTVIYGGKSVSFDLIVGAKEHVFTVRETDKDGKFTVVDPTCTEPGGYKAGCAALDGCKEVGVEYDAEKMPAKGHTFGDWTVTKAATCTAEGTETRTCKDCGETETRAIAKTAHEYVNGVCKNCGAKQSTTPTQPANPAATSDTNVSPALLTAVLCLSGCAAVVIKKKKSAK